MQTLRNWMIDTATILFDDSKNDLRALPKTVRLQLLLVLSFIWSTVFSILIFSMATFIWGWLGVFLAHLALIMVSYATFKIFHNAKKKYPYKFDSYHSVGRARGGMRGLHGEYVEWDPNDPGGEHE